MRKSRSRLERFALMSIVLFFISFISGCVSTVTESQPNIIIFFTDDQGYGDLGCYGGKGFQTPHIDKLAANGIRFTDFYVAASVCTPSRAALLTGKYPKQLGLHEAVIFPYSKHGLAPEETTLPEILRDKGYTTAMIGKWHLGHHSPKFMPNNHGFDFFYGVPYSNDMDGHYYGHNKFQSPPLQYYKNTDIVAEGLNQDGLTKMWTEAAIDVIQSSADKPFFLYLAHNMPHLPWHASEEFRGSSEKGLYGDIMQEIDWSMGEIIKTLQEKGIANNTIIIFTSDNGQQARKNGGSAGPLRGSKAQTWEGGMRVPGIISWPAKVPKGIVCETPVSTMDLLPTIATLTGSEIPTNSEIKGRDISQILFHPEDKYDHVFELVYYNREGLPEAIRQGNWKLHIGKNRGWNKNDGDFPVSLYNLKDDIGECTNLAEKFPDIVSTLSNRLTEIDGRL